jgi:hypothetical protein
MKDELPAMRFPFIGIHAGSPVKDEPGDAIAFPGNPWGLPVKVELPGRQILIRGCAG